MKIEINAKQANILADLLMDEELRVGDRINRADSDESIDELKERAQLIYDLSVKVCTVLAKKKKGA